MDVYQPNNFLFSSKYQVWRHVLFWLVHTVLTAFFWVNADNPQTGRVLFGSFLWTPVRMLYCYPLMYWVLPQFLLKGKYTPFAIIILLWGIGGWFLNYAFRAYAFIPILEYLGFEGIRKDPWNPGTFLILTTTAGITCGIVLFKHWMKKQQEWVQSQKEKVTAELQLLKAQIHPHFLFNTLNNIYSFSLQNSPKTPGMILKLSSLLSYMLYECKGDEVLLEKELEVMKNYIDLEKERYGNRLEISWNVEGEVKDICVAPLLLLPFLENAFKHGTSEQLEKPWLGMDITVKQGVLRCKIANSKNEFVPISQNGIGIQNVKKRLQLLYPDKHQLKVNDEGEFFVVSLLLQLKDHKIEQPAWATVAKPVIQKAVL